VSTAIRLIDMGIPGYMVATALEAIIAQRLVRRICESCATEHKPTAQEAAWLHTFAADQADKLRFRHGAGCPHCNNTGYSGRVGVFELLEMNDVMADALRRNDDAAFTHAARAHPAYRSLAQNALEIAARGVTTIEEVLRIAGENEVFTMPETVMAVQ